MGHHVIEYDELCKSCHGTGIYVGIRERDGAGVVCYKCDGTGCHHIKTEYDDFDRRRVPDGVLQVFECNPGIGIAEKGANKRFSLSDFGGQPYAEWADGKPFPPGSEMRAFTCPAWWYQTTDYKRKPEWEECWGANSFSNCPYFDTKELCWARWDREQAKAKPREEA